MRHPLLDEALGASVWIKLENTTPIGAFKIRGGINLIATLERRDRRAGICAPTRGNHGQALAYAAARAGVRCTLFVPEGNSPDKNRAMRAFGAEVLVAGSTFDESHEAATQHSRKTRCRYVHPGHEPALIAGAGTVGLEMIESAPDPLDVIFVPVGVGSLAAGTALACAAASPTTRVIGVGASAAPAMHDAFHTGKLEAREVIATVADGLAVGSPVSTTLALMREHLFDMCRVDEPEIHAAIQLYASSLHQLAEGAGAAALAGAIRYRQQFAGQRVGVVLSGGNIDMTTFAEVLRSCAATLVSIADGR